MKTYGGGLLDDLLVAALDGAVALEEMDNVAVLVREHLELDVARPIERQVTRTSVSQKNVCVRCGVCGVACAMLGRTW